MNTSDMSAEDYHQKFLHDLDIRKDKARLAEIKASLRTLLKETVEIGNKYRSKLLTKEM